MTKKPARIYHGALYLGVKYLDESLFTDRFIRLPITRPDPMFVLDNTKLDPLPATIYAEQIRPGVFVTDDPVTADQLDINEGDTLFEDFVDTMKEVSTPPIMRLTLCCIEELRRRGALFNLLTAMRKETE